jgi:hypothetical protein
MEKSQLTFESLNSIKRWKQCRKKFQVKQLTIPFLEFQPVKVETPIHDSIRELLTWECKEHGVKS